MLKRIMKKIYKHIMLITLLISGAVAPLFSAMAQESPYVIENITISLPSGGNVSKKRDLAVKKATKQGFNQLLQNITPQEEWVRHEDVIANVNWNNILEKFIIVKEQTSPRYNLTLNLFFNKNMVRNLLHELKIPYAESKKLKLLVLPLMDTDTRLLLWDKDNKWRTALSSIDSNQHLLNFTLPIGDMSEVTNITAEMVNLGAEDVLLDLAKQYSSDGVIVSRLRTFYDNSQAVLESENRWYGNNSLNTTIVQYPVDYNETMPVALNKMALLTYQKLEQEWQKSGVVQLKEQGKVFIRFSPKSATDLEKLTSLIESFNTVDKVQLRVLNIENSLFEVSYFGDAQNLANVMTSNGLQLSFKGSLWWVSFKND